MTWHGKRLQEEPCTQHGKCYRTDADEPVEFVGFQSRPEAETLEKIVSLGKSPDLEVVEGDLNKLVEDIEGELSTEELKDLQTMQHTKPVQEISIEVGEVTSTSEVKEMLAMWGKLSSVIEKTPRKSFNWSCFSAF